MLQRMRQSNPQLFSQIQSMVNGKSEDELKVMAQNIASDRGIDLPQFASQFGIKF